MTTRSEGTGLGLPIVAKILADHGGGLELRDAPHGRGAWFGCFSLGAMKRSAFRTLRTSRRRGRNTRIVRELMASDILIVDDEADIRDIVSGILSDEGHGARTAKNSDDALAAIEARRPSLIFLDIWLQGSRLDGLQLLRIIKEQNRCSRW